MRSEASTFGSPRCVESQAIEGKSIGNIVTFRKNDDRGIGKADGELSMASDEEKGLRLQRLL